MQPPPICSAPFSSQTPEFPTLRTPRPLADSAAAVHRTFRFYPIARKSWEWNDFGMNVNGLVGNYPTIPVGALRLWSSQWHGVQPKPDEWDWEKLDAEVERAVLD